MAIDKERKPKRWELYKLEWQIPEPRTDEPVGLYPRQSTNKQLKNNRQSFEKQTQDAMEDLLKRGWIRELIRVYDQDMGHTAAKPIEDREAMNQMLDDIRERRIRTVRASEVDRLFRDEDRIDSNLFIKMCREADCLVMTDRMTYDLRLPRHQKWFRDEVDRSWEFYESQILIRAQEHRDRARRKGQYTGHAIPIGYIVDKNPKSPTYMKYIPHNQHAPRTPSIFQWLYDCGGILGALYDKIAQLHYVWSLEEEWVREQRAFWTNLDIVYGTEIDEEGNLKPIGYSITPLGVTRLLRNRVYLGEWNYDGEWIEQNHDPIVPKDLFDYAQAVLDGNKQARDLGNAKNHTSPQSVIHDILYPGPEGVKKRSISAKGRNYIVRELRNMRLVVLGSIGTHDIEQVFLQKFLERLRDTKLFENYEQKVSKDEENAKIEARQKNILALITDLTEHIDGIFLTLQSPELEKEDRQAFIEERNRLKRRRETLRNEANIKSPMQVYLQYKDLITKMGQHWEKYPLEDRLSLVALLVKRVYLEPLSHHFMKLTIEWKAFPKDEGVFWRRNANTIHWTPEEDQILRDMYPRETPKAILQTLPRRTWAGIMSRAADLPVRRLEKPEGAPYRDLSVEDLQIIAEYNIPMEKLGEALFTIWSCLFRESKRK